MQLGQGVVQRLDHRGRETEARLVEHEEARLAHQRTAEREHLPLAARQRAGELLAAFGEPREQRIDALEQRRGARAVGKRGCAEPQILFDIPPRAFVPPPKVTSSVVRIVPRPEPLAPADQPALERVTAAAFGQRRKMLRTSLKTLGFPVEPLLKRAGVAPTARAEELTVAEFCALARAAQACSPELCRLVGGQAGEEVGKAE